MYLGKVDFLMFEIEIKNDPGTWMPLVVHLPSATIGELSLADWSFPLEGRVVNNQSSKNLKNSR